MGWGGRGRGQEGGRGERERAEVPNSGSSSV